MPPVRRNESVPVPGLAGTVVFWLEAHCFLITPDLSSLGSMTVAPVTPRPWMQGTHLCVHEVLGLKLSWGRGAGPQLGALRAGLASWMAVQQRLECDPAGVGGRRLPGLLNPRNFVNWLTSGCSQQTPQSGPSPHPRTHCQPGSSTPSVGLPPPALGTTGRTLSFLSVVHTSAEFR